MYIYIYTISYHIMSYHIISIYQAIYLSIYIHIYKCIHTYIYIYMKVQLHLPDENALRSHHARFVGPKGVTIGAHFQLALPAVR